MAYDDWDDIHRQTAALIFDVPLDAVTKDMRARAKTINFATIYGQGAHALSRQDDVVEATYDEPVPAPADDEDDGDLELDDEVIADDDDLDEDEDEDDLDDTSDDIDFDDDEDFDE